MEQEDRSASNQKGQDSNTKDLADTNCNSTPTSDKQRNYLGCLFTNADTLTNKSEELKARKDAEYTMIIGINEVLPKNSRYAPTVPVLSIEGYDLFINNLSGKTGIRGTALYIKSDLKATEVSMSVVFKKHIFVSVDLAEGNKLLIGCIYRSPNSSEENNDSLNYLLLEAGNSKYSHKLIMGSFSYRNINWVSYTTEYENKIEIKFIETVREISNEDTN